MQKTVAEYFAGIGLVRLGLEQAGWQTAYANDFDPHKAAMYREHFADAATIYDSRDIFEVTAADVPPTLLAAASFPCVGLSLAGKRGGIYAPHSNAFWGVVDIFRDQGAGITQATLTKPGHVNSPVATKNGTFTALDTAKNTVNVPMNVCGSGRLRR